MYAQHAGRRLHHRDMRPPVQVKQPCMVKRVIYDSFDYAVQFHMNRAGGLMSLWAIHVRQPHKD